MVGFLRPTHLPSTFIALLPEIIALLILYHGVLEGEEVGTTYYTIAIMASQYQQNAPILIPPPACTNILSR
jgi:hypothetical protein